MHLDAETAGRETEVMRIEGGHTRGPSAGYLIANAIQWKDIKLYISDIPGWLTAWLCYRFALCCEILRECLLIYQSRSSPLPGQFVNTSSTISFGGLRTNWSSNMSSFDATIEKACKDIVIPGAVLVASSADGILPLPSLLPKPNIHQANSAMKKPSEHAPSRPPHL
jgi:hypothetical protein